MNIETEDAKWVYCEFVGQALATGTDMNQKSYKSVSLAVS